jgi:flagella synthesis protein FlgN
MSPAASNPLDEEVGKLGEFIAVLQREQELLKKGDTDALLPLIETKTQLADRLATLARAREEHLVRQGFTNGRAGMEDWLQRNGNTAQRQSWQTLLEQAREARDLNEINGRLIGLHMQHNQQAFTALMNATNRAMTYGPDGQQQTGLGGRILGTA